MTINKTLYNFFCWNDIKEIKAILNTFEDVDILYKNGVFFDFAISKGNVEICKALITYFEDKQFSIKNIQYQEAKNKLQEILENITDNIDLSLEMKQILAPYIDFEGSDHDTLNDSLLDDYKVAFDEMLEKNNSNENFLTEDNLKKLNEVMENKVKTSENLISFHSAPELIHRQLDHYEDPSNKDVHVSLSGNHLIDTN